METAFQMSLRASLRKTLDFVDNRILQSTGGAALTLPSLKARQRRIELLLILAAVGFYCLPFLDLNTRNRLPGNESEVFQSLDQFLDLGLKQGGRFPLWNPYINSGIPYAGDPMLHAYNPFISVPVLLFGTLIGFKIAVFLGFLIGAVGMWWLARLLRLGPAGRLWMSLLYAFSGAAMARFFQGQYLLQIAPAWLPWIIAGLYASLITRRRKYIAAAAVSMALLFLCGNAYYAYYTLYAIAILALVMVIQRRSLPSRLPVDFAALKVLLAAGVLACGLIAIQLLPLAGFWSRIAKETDASLSESQSVGQVILDFVSTDSHRADAIATLPREEFYAYIGSVPLLLLILLPLAWRRGNRRILTYFVLLFIFTLLWIDARDMPWRGIFRVVQFLSQFRYPSRMLIFATIAVAVLSGMAVDAFIHRLDSYAEGFAQRWLRFLPAGIKYLLVIFLAISIGNVVAANRPYLASQQYYPAPDVVLGWLKQQDNGIYYIDAPNGWHLAALDNRLRYLNAWYHFNDIRRIDDRINARNVQATAKFEILGNDAPAPQGSILVRRFDQHTIYLHPDSLPFAFTVPTSTLTTPGSDLAPLEQRQTNPVDPYTPDSGSIEAIVDGGSNQTLVVLSTLMPGWQLTIDDRPEPILNVSGYMAASLLPGTHRYLFSYRPGSFTAGWLITLLFLLTTLTLAASDYTPRWRAALERVRQTDWQEWAERVRNWRPVPAAALPAGAADRAADQTLLQWLQRLPRVWLSSFTWHGVLFAGALGIYLVAVLYRISDFPIYFFTDEAVHMNEAADLVLHGFRNSQHEFLPTYFNIGTMFSLNGLSVYLQLVPYLLFGKSVSVTRGVSALITAVGAIAAALTLRNVFKIRQYWLGILLLIASPAWFLHARTAFEYAELAAFYAVFLYCYLQYRAGKTGYLFAAVVSGAMVFYTHGLGQVLISVTGLLLFLVDIRFHFRRENRRALLYALGLTVLVALPYARYQLAHPEVTAGQMSQRGSYLVDNGLGLIDKMGRFAHEYFYGLNPLYWYFPNDHDLARHVMKGYGHIWIGTLPFALIGLMITVRRFSDPSHRALLIALAAAPVPASLVAVGIIRELWFMIPAALLTGLGIAAGIGRLNARSRAVAMVSAALVFGVLSGFALFMLHDSLTNGPTWFQDYTLYGMQYGGKQVFADDILPRLKGDQNIHYVVSPNWANGTDQLLFFFIPAKYLGRVTIDTVDSYMSSRKEMTPDTVFIMMPDEHQRAEASPLFSKVDVAQTIPYPNGKPGFYAMHLAYADNADVAFAQMETERRKPVEGSVVVNGDPAAITYSRIETGQPSDLFDGKFDTLVRGVEANPFIIELAFQHPFKTSGLSADFGHMNLKLRVRLFVNNQQSPLQFETSESSAEGDPHVDLGFGGAYEATRIDIEITDLDLPAGQPAKIHVRELKFVP